MSVQSMVRAVHTAGLPYILSTRMKMADRQCYSHKNSQIMDSHKPACTSTSALVKDRLSLQNVRLIFQWRGQMSHYFLVSRVIVQLFFCNSQTSHSKSCDLLVAHGTSLHLTDKHYHSHLFSASVTQCRLLSGTGPWL